MGLDDYKPLVEIGRGGMGVVLKGRSKDGREVAVKVLRKAEHRRHLARFDRERRLLMELGEHEGFVPLLDAGDSPQGPFIVMPFFGGGTLKTRLRNGPLGLAPTVSLGRSIAAAMGRAHAAGIVHRDLKPDNILYTKGGRPLVADLGLAKHFRQDDPDVKSLSLSNPGSAIGTLGYMAPEQMRNAKAAGPEADVWAIGAILYECLSGVRLYRASSVLELVRAVDEGSHDPLPKSVPEWLAEIVEKAIATEPKDRFKDGAELAAALERGAGTRSTHRKLAVAGGVLVGLVAAVVIMGRSTPPRPAPAPPPSGAPPAALLSGTTTQPPPSEIAAATSQTPAPEQEGRDPTGEKPGKKERELLDQADAAALAGKKDEAYSLYLDLGDRALAKNHPKLAALAYEKAVAFCVNKKQRRLALTQLGYTETRTGSFESAAATLKRAIELAPEDPLLRNNLGYVLHVLGRDAEAVEEYRRCLELEPNYYLARMSLANICRATGDPKQALKEHRALLKEAAIGFLDPGSTWTFNYESKGKEKGAVVSFDTDARKISLVRFEVALDRAFLEDLPGAEKALAEAKEKAFDAEEMKPAIEKGLDEIARALEVDPRRYALRFVAGVLHTMNGDKERARAELELFRTKEAEHGGPLADRATELLEGLK